MQWPDMDTVRIMIELLGLVIPWMGTSILNVISKIREWRKEDREEFAEKIEQLADKLAEAARLIEDEPKNVQSTLGELCSELRILGAWIINRMNETGLINSVTVEPRKLADPNETVTTDVRAQIHHALSVEQAGEALLGKSQADKEPYLRTLREMAGVCRGVAQQIG